jgi:hypothetical protein
MSLGALVAMTHAGYVAAGWIATVIVLGGYAAATIRRGRRLSLVVPPEERRWS